MEDKPKDFITFVGEKGRQVKVGIQRDEHTDQSKSNNRDPFVCVKQNGSKWGGRRFCYNELMKVGEEFDPSTHKMNHDLGIFAVTLGDDGAFKHEFEMTLVGRLFFSDFQCMNRSYVAISRDSCINLDNDPGWHGCGSITFHAKNGLLNGDLAINTRYMKYDGAKSGCTPLPYRHDLVNVLPTTAQIRRLRRESGHLDADAFEDVVVGFESYGLHRWNIMADRLQVFAERNGWKKDPSNGNKGIHNIVETERCIDEDYTDREISDGNSLIMWWKRMLGLVKWGQNYYYVLTEEQKARLEKIGMSFHAEDIKAVEDILRKKAGEGIQRIKSNANSMGSSKSAAKNSFFDTHQWKG